MNAPNPNDLRRALEGLSDPPTEGNFFLEAQLVARVQTTVLIGIYEQLIRMNDHHEDFDRRLMGSECDEPTAVTSEVRP